MAVTSMPSSNGSNNNNSGPFPTGQSFPVNLSPLSQPLSNKFFETRMQVQQVMQPAGPEPSGISNLHLQMLTFSPPSAPQPTISPSPGIAFAPIPKTLTPAQQGSLLTQQVRGEQSLAIAQATNNEKTIAAQQRAQERLQQRQERALEKDEDRRRREEEKRENELIKTEGHVERTRATIEGKKELVKEAGRARMERDAPILEERAARTQRNAELKQANVDARNFKTEVLQQNYNEKNRLAAIREERLRDQHELSRERLQLRENSRKQAFRQQIASGNIGGLAQNFAARTLPGAFAAGAINIGARVAGALNFQAAVSMIPLVGETGAGLLNMLEQLGRNAAGFELPALQAGLTFGQATSAGISDYATANSSYVKIKDLSNRLGINPSQAATILRDVGVGTQGAMSVETIAALTMNGFSPTQISATAGQLGAVGAGGVETALRTLSIARNRGLSVAQSQSFLGRVTGFATQRRLAGLAITDASLTARRARSMGGDLEANVATLGRFQSVGVAASKRLSGFAAGMVDMMLQASAFAEAEGDIFKATKMLEDESADPPKMRRRMLEMGATEEQIDIALLGTGQLTTGDIRKGKSAILGKEAGELKLPVVDKGGKALSTARATAERAQADLEQFFAGGQIGMSRDFSMLLKQQARYQEEVLKIMPTADLIKKTNNLIMEVKEAVRELIQFFGGRRTEHRPPVATDMEYRQHHMTQLKAQGRQF